MAVLNEVQRERIQRGAILLDAKNPGWENEVNLEGLEIHSYGNCVLAQLYGGYDTGLKSLEVGIYEAIDYGFFPHADELVENEYGKDADMDLEDEKTAYWKEQIHLRRDRL
jgi:hypothetical protein